MFKDISIKYFRGIRQLQLDGFGQVNLFLGCNNCGKSTVLDALFLMSGAANPLLNVKINNIRNYDNIDQDDLLLNYYNLDTEEPIRLKSLQTNETLRELTIHPFSSISGNIDMRKGAASSLSNKETEDSYGYTLDLNLKPKNQKESLFTSSLTVTSQDRGNVKIEKALGYKEEILAQYMSSSFDFKESMKKLDEMLQNKEEHHIVEILQKIEPRIHDIMLGDKAVMIDVGLPKRVPVNIMGDGIRKMLAIIISVFDCKNGVLLIDEIDNGLHYKSMPVLWTAVLEMAKKRNVQIFASTHNVDSLKGLEQILSESQHDMQDKTVTYTLRRLPEGDLRAFRYDYEKFNYVINQEIEIR